MVTSSTPATQHTAAPNVGDGSPALRYTGLLPRINEGLPGSWAVLFVRAVVQHPAGYDPSSPLPLFEEITGEAVVAFRENRTLGIRIPIAFEAATPRLTRSRAYASPASLPRPSQGSLPARAGSPLAGRDSHPLDDKRSFMEPSQSSNSLRPAGPGRTDSPMDVEVSRVGRAASPLWTLRTAGTPVLVSLCIRSLWALLQNQCLWCPWCPWKTRRGLIVERRTQRPGARVRQPFSNPGASSELLGPRAAQ